MTHDQPDMRARIRFGGIQASGGFLFELTGGRLCLDLANTLDDRGTDHPKELLRSASDLFNWARQADVLEVVDLRRLKRHAAAHPRLAASVLVRLVTLREHIFAAFSALATNTPIPGESLGAINAAVSAAAARRRVEARGCGATWTWERDTTQDLDAVLWRAAWSAAELLTSPEASRVRQCAGAGCRWLFLDTTKNRTRRWCDMTVCGNRTKSRRHYARVRGSV